MDNKIIGVKGFDEDLKCRGYQFEVGKNYKEDYAKCYEYSFHFCENPLDVFGYYTPENSRYCIVEGTGKIDIHQDGSKISCTKMKIVREIQPYELADLAKEYLEKKAEDKKINTGDQSYASVEGKKSVAIVTGYQSKEKGTLNCWLVLTERNGCYEILGIQSVKVDGEVIKEDTWYWLNDGKVEEYKNE